jgi:hypothetical protein
MLEPRIVAARIHGAEDLAQGAIAAVERMTASSQGDRMKLDISRALETEAHRDLAKNRAHTQAKTNVGSRD